MLISSHGVPKQKSPSILVEIVKTLHQMIIDRCSVLNYAYLFTCYFKEVRDISFTIIICSVVWCYLMARNSLNNFFCPGFVRSIINCFLTPTGICINFYFQTIIRRAYEVNPVPELVCPPACELSISHLSPPRWLFYN